MSKILSAIASLAVAFLGSLLPINPNPQYLAQPGQNLGITISKGTVDFSDNLSAPITASSTTFTLVRGTNTYTATALSGDYIFRIDNEFLEATCVSTACTVVTRGLSDEDLKTHVYAQTKPHSRFAAVKVTDAYILRISRILNGDETAPNIIQYTNSNNSFTTSSQLVSKGYADGLAIAGAPDSSGSQKGIVESAQISELASGALAGDTTAPLDATSGNFSASYTGTQKVPVTQGNGVLAPGFLPTASSVTWTASQVFSATTTFNGNLITASSGVVQVFTAGETINTASSVYLFTDGKVYNAGTSTNVFAKNFLGIALQAATAGNYVYIASVGSLVTSSLFPTLTAGQPVYQSSATGSITLSAPVGHVMSIGIAKSATQILLTTPRLSIINSYQFSGAASEVQVWTATGVGFRPREININGSISASNLTQAYSTGTCTLKFLDGAGGFGTYMASNILNGGSPIGVVDSGIPSNCTLAYWSSSTERSTTIVVGITNTGFTMTNTQGATAGGTASIVWEATE